MDVSGIFNVDKPRGLTSHDVVVRVRDRLRRAVGQKVKVGHAGTLDPLATGVLVVCVGQATRVAEYAMQTRKTYRAGIRLGISTDTYDAEGEITQIRPVPDFTTDDLDRALQAFVGKISQHPPTYSAIKQDGEALYKKARRGETVTVTPREVEIYEIKLVSSLRREKVPGTGACPRRGACTRKGESAWHLLGKGVDFTIDVTCSSGTYIRSLAHDIGERLGCGAHLYHLTRLQSGHFALADAVTLEALQGRFDDGTWRAVLLPMDTALRDLPRVVLNREQVARIRHGQPVGAQRAQQRAQHAAPLQPLQPLRRAYTEAGELVALLRYDEQHERWQPHKVFIGYANIG